MMKLALHIGTEKTGTTLLQEWLYHNQAALSGQGYFLSDMIGKPCNRDIVSYFRRAPDDFWNRNNIRSEVEKERFFGGFREKLSEELRHAEKTHHTMVMSSEHFHSRLHVSDDLAEFAAFCRQNFSEVRVICYLRPQWAVRKSLYSTGLKTNSTVELADFDTNLSPDSHYYNYYGLYRRWGENFGFESLDFRIYDRKNFSHGDLRYDFLEAIGSGDGREVLDFTIESANESVKLLLGHALIGINKAVPLFANGGMDARNYYYKSIVNHLDILDAGEIVDDRALEVADMFRQSNTQLAREAFGKEQLFADPVPADVQQTVFTAQDVGRIVEALTHAFTRRTSRRLLFDGDADVLRDVALKWESGAEIDRDEAVQLMQLASRARPAGALIQRKLRQWTEQE